MMQRSPQRPARGAQADAAAQRDADHDEEVGTNNGGDEVITDTGDVSSVAVPTEPVGRQSNTSTSSLLERARSATAERKAIAAVAASERALRRSTLNEYLGTSTEQRALMADQLADQQQVEDVDELDVNQTSSIFAAGTWNP
jgi:predicted transcriptional regulator